MAKTKEQLLPNDKVMVEFGPVEEYNNNTRKMVQIEPAKAMDVPYQHFLDVTESADDYDQETGLVKLSKRTVKLLGLAVYKDHVTDMGDTVPVPSVQKFGKSKGEVESEPEI